jgi:hypothetical protein
MREHIVHGLLFATADEEGWLCWAIAVGFLRPCDRMQKQASKQPLTRSIVQLLNPERGASF